jgi:hypothetical protein
MASLSRSQRHANQSNLELKNEPLGSQVDYGLFATHYSHPQQTLGRF